MALAHHSPPHFLFSPRERKAKERWRQASAPPPHALPKETASDGLTQKLAVLRVSMDKKRNMSAIIMGK